MAIVTEKKVKSTAEYLAVRFISSPSQRKKFLRELAVHRKVKEFFYIIDIIQEVALTLLPIFQGIAANYIYSWLTRKRRKELSEVLDEIYEKEVKDNIIRYKKRVTRLKNYVAHHPDSNTRETRAIINNHEKILAKLYDKPKAMKIIYRLAMEHSKLKEREVEQYLNKCRRWRKKSKKKKLF